MRILILEHQPDAPACLLARWAQDRGHELEVVGVPSLQGWRSPEEVDAIVTLGSEHSVLDVSHAWIAEEVEFLSAAHSAEIPVLGICFGGQILSKALGGEVSRAAAPEVTWRAIESRASDLITAGPWMFWHEDQFTLPPGAALLAGSDQQVSAFAHGASIGLQFHPEADAAVVRGWIEGARDKLGTYGVDVQQLERAIDVHGPQARDLAFDLFDRIAVLWSQAPTARQPSLG